MKKFKSIFIIVILCLISLVFLLKTEKTNKSEQFVRRKDALLRLIKNSTEIHRIWLEGEDSREWGLVRNQCLKKYNITESFDESLLRCRPMLLACINEFLPKKLFNSINNKSDAYSYQFTLEDSDTHEKLDISLNNKCHELYLEQGIYAYGEAPKNTNADDYKFDIYNRHIYFDQHLVTNDELNEWIKSYKTELNTITNGNLLFKPASQLSLKQMRSYCSFRGQQLMEAHIYDAATFLTADKMRSPFYWTKKIREKNISCLQIYTEECLPDFKWKIDSSSASWAGLYNSLGGVPEALRNPVDPDSNLKASSFYFQRTSPWHRLGFRANWDGLGNERRNINFRGIDPLTYTDKFEIGFRCMREVYQ